MILYVLTHVFLECCRKMPHTTVTHVQHTSFKDLTVDGFKTYSSDLVNARVGAQERQRAFSYLSQIAAKDKSSLETERSTLVTKRIKQRAQQLHVDSLISDHVFDFSVQPTLFQNEVMTNAQVATLLLQSNAKVYLQHRDLATKVIITGSNITLDGRGTGSAKDGTLTSTSTATTIEIFGNDNIIRGMKFTADSSSTVKFTGSSTNITFEDCIFDGASVAGYKWWVGTGSYLQGDMTVKNCVIKNYENSIYLGETSVGTPTVALRDVVISDCKFDNCSGSFIVKGLQATPIRKATIADNVFDHPSPNTLFTDTVEVSGAVKKVIITGNTATISAPGTARGFALVSSKSAFPWSVVYKSNTLSGYRVGLKISLSENTYYSPDTQAEDYEIVIKESELTNVDYGASFLERDVATGSSIRWVPQSPAGDYNPGNLTVYPSPPSVTTEGTVAIVS